MIEVFKTNVRESSQAEKVVRYLLRHFPDSDIHFDLEDRDNVLRIEGRDIRVKKVTALLQEKGFTCEALP